MKERPTDVPKQAARGQGLDGLAELRATSLIGKWHEAALALQTLYWRVPLSSIVKPSSASRDVEHACCPGHRQRFSTQGLAYVSTLLHTSLCPQIGSSCSERTCAKKVAEMQWLARCSLLRARLRCARPGAAVTPARSRATCALAIGTDVQPDSARRDDSAFVVKREVLARLSLSQL